MRKHDLRHVVRLPGVLIGLLMLTVKEPKRTGVADTLDKKVSISDAIKYMQKRWRIYLFIFLGFAFMGAPISSALTWIPSALLFSSYRQVESLSVVG